MLAKAATELRSTDRPSARPATLLGRLASRLTPGASIGSAAGAPSTPGGEAKQQRTFSCICDSIRDIAMRLAQRDGMVAAAHSLATPEQAPPPRRRRLVREAARLAASALDGPHWI